MPPRPVGARRRCPRLGPVARSQRRPRRPHQPGPGDWPCRPAQTVQDAGDSDWGPRHVASGGPAALAGPGRGTGHAAPPGRCKTQVTRTGGPWPAADGDPAALTGPGWGTGHAAPPGRCKTQVTRTGAGRLGRTAAATRLLPTGAVHGKTSQPFSRRGHPPSSAGGGRRVKVTLPPTPCTQRAATRPRVYTSL